MELVKVSPAGREKGSIFLVLDARAQNGKGRQRYTIIGRNGGRSWRAYSANSQIARGGQSTQSGPKTFPPATTSTSSPNPVASSGGNGASRTGASSGGTVDLASLDTVSSNSSSASVSSPAGGGGGSGLGIPEFRFMFDFWLYHRPNIAPLTFSNIHTLAMIDILPVPELQFSFELSPTPRYYQLSYQLSPKLELRAGRIWIPFDVIGPQFPHNMFGGFVNVSQFRQPGGTAFLPDIWTDLGVAMKYQLVESEKLSWALQLYLVNGFQDGGNDPASEVGNRYPNFESAAAIDNNSDKAVGFRTHAMWFNRFGLGVSGYMGRYTDASDEGKTIAMLGVDAQIKFAFGFDIKAGYAFMNVALPSPATTPSYRRGGMYVEGTQRIARTWKLFARGGTVQNDSRVIGVDDVTMVGGGIIYTLGYLQLTVMYQHDLNTVTSKTSYDFMATRAAIML